MKNFNAILSLMLVLLLSVTMVKAQYCDAPAWEAVSVTNNSDLDVWMTITDGWSMNGYCGGGCEEQVDQWLVYGPLDMSSPASLSLSFDAAENFGSTDINILFTTDYASGCPANASWTLAGTVSDAGTATIDLSGASGSAVYIGIEYSDDGVDGYSDWDLTNFQLSADVCPAVGESIVSDCNTGAGCIDSDACNFDAEATVDDGSCFKAGDSCDDGDPTTSRDEITASCNCEGTQSSEAPCFADSTCDFEIVAVALNSQSDNWTCSAGSYQANGFVGSGTEETSDLWLIGGVYDFTGAGSITLQLDADEGFNGSNIEIFYTLTYSGCPGETSNNWVSTGVIASGAGGTGLSIDLSAAAGSATVYIGIQYLSGSAPANTSNWTLSNISLLADTCPTIGAPTASSCDTGTPGCTDSDACNFNMDATADDGSCYNIGDACDDEDGTTNNDVYTDCNTCAGTPIVFGDCPDSAKINEFHYDNAGQDVNEFVEIALPAGSDPTQVQVNLYNGSNGSSYNSIVLSAAEFISSDGTSDFYVWVVIPQNGSSDGDGIAVSCIDGTQYQFITYEGSFIASDGPFAGIDGLDIGVEEPGDAAETSSIMCDANGNYLTNCVADPGAANNLNSCVNVVAGCTDEAACNYNAEATMDDGSCFSIGDACDDGNSATLNDVYIDCSTCIGEDSGMQSCETPVWEAVSVVNNSQLDLWTDITDVWSMNGFCDQGCAEQIDQWLVYGPLDMSGTSALNLVFGAAEEFGVTDLNIYFTADYTSACPANAIWTLAATITDEGSANVDLSAASGTAVYIGIEYSDDGADGYSKWDLKNFQLFADVCPAVGTAIVSGCDVNILGCTSDSACNYNPIATADDSSCLFDGDPCTDDNGNVSVFAEDCSCPPIQVTCATSAKINEFHYDNTGTDVNEFVEIALPAGSDPTTVQIVLYNGSNGASYDSIVLSAVEYTSSNATTDFYVWLPDNLQNDSDGIALGCTDGTLYQFITYEGSFIAMDGPFTGVEGTDIGVEESSDAPETASIMCDGSGNFMANCTADAGTTNNLSTCITIISDCTDPCDPNYNPDATEDDPSLCMGYSTDCDDNECANGVEIWNAGTCMCEAGTPPADPGCDDFDCTNGLETWDGCSCISGTPPINPGCDDGDCSNGVETWDGCECVAGIAPVDPGCDDGVCSNGIETYNTETCLCEDGEPGEIPTCDDGDCNTEDTYDEANCICVNTPIDPPSCDDGDCNTEDSYDSATCACVNTPLTPPNCDDNDGCTEDSYDELTCTCINEPVTEIPGCDDGDCNTLNTYDEENCVCVTTPIDPPNCDDNDCNTEDSYDSATCTCVNTPITPPNCDDGDCNTEDSYDIATCTCVNEQGPVPGCDDADCNTADFYDQDNCECVFTPIEPLNCDDNICGTEDSYDSDTCTCVNTPIEPPVCDDGVCSNGVETYNAETCICEDGIPGEIPTCDDGDCNTEDTYDEANCVCVNTPIDPPNCDDSDCNTEDSYDLATCTCINTPIDTPNCDDGDCNTEDSYDSVNCVCINTFIGAPDCNDGDCNTINTYDYVTCECTVTPIEPPVCDDGDCSNGVETYNTETCMCEEGVPGEIPTCDDNDCSTEDTYDNANCVCVNTPIDPPDCDDNDCGTDDSYDSASCTCVNVPGEIPDCNDGDCATEDSYDEVNCVCINYLIDFPNPTDGCDLTFDFYDPVTCELVNDPNCPDGTTFNEGACACDDVPVPGCTDPCAPNYNAGANTDDGSCESYSTDCNEDCVLGPFGGTWDEASCACINDIDPVNGCTDSNATNYNPDANCDDDYCIYDSGCTAEAATIDGGPFTFCVGDDTDDFVSGITADGGAGSNTAWVITDDQLNILGLPSMPGVVNFETTGAGTCLIWYVVFEDITGAEEGQNAADLGGCFALSNSIEVVRQQAGCTDPNATNYNADAQCDDGSCELPADCTSPPAIGTFDCE